MARGIGFAGGAIALLVVAALPACRGPGGGSPNRSTPFPTVDCGNLAARLDRGDWMVNQATRVSKVLETRLNQPPREIGYLVASEYRQMRGGPVFTMYKVTTLDREQQIGHIDQMGRGARYEPQRNGTFEAVDIGVGTLEDQVSAIFGLSRAVILEPTSERRLAFEALDRNGDGLLGREEAASYGGAVIGADRNGDGVVDFEEFDALDDL
jgi:hypothetical protein